MSKAYRSNLAGGFTLVELLVVIGIIGVLAGLLMPSLSRARGAADSIRCAANLRELLAAAQLYAGENQGFFPPAHIDFSTTNLHRWHGTRGSVAEAFTPTGGPLAKFLPQSEIRQCPSFVFAASAKAFERSAGGYGYNDAYLGSSDGVSTASDADNVPAKVTQVRRPAEKIAFGDAAIAGPGLMEYSFVTPPVFSGGVPASPSIHFRHNKVSGRPGSANIGWADGHVTAERFGWTYTKKNAYGANNQKFDLGYFGPRDNGLFER